MAKLIELDLIVKDGQRPRGKRRFQGCLESESALVAFLDAATREDTVYLWLADEHAAKLTQYQSVRLTIEAT